MAKQVNTTVVPRLRFPDFRGVAGWEMQPLSSLLDYERPDKYIVSDTAYQSSGIPVLTANKSFVLGYTNEATGIYTATPVVIFDDFTTDKKYVDFPFKVKSSAIKILTAKADDSLKLIFELMGGIKFDPKEHKRYYISEYQNLEIPLPRPVEQEKITTCLNSLDELITVQRRKVDALKTYKRGLMQQLFPREGEVTPQLRFPEFHLDWEEKPLCALAKYENGKAYEQDIQDVGRYVVVNSRFISTDGAIRKYSNANHCIASVGDVLMVLSDLPNGRALAKCFYVDSSDKYAVNQRVGRLTPTDVYPQFLYHRLNRHPNLLAFDDGLNQTHLSKSSVTDCPLFVPASRIEQEKIAGVLSSLDADILAEFDRHSALMAHKKGLMQQLFPSSEAG